MVRPSNTPTTRRDALRITGTAVGTAAVSALAGCSALQSATGSDSPTYANWLPAPDTVLPPDDANTSSPFADLESYPFVVRDYDAIGTYLNRSDTPSKIETPPPLHPVLDVDVGDLGLKVKSGRGFVVTETALDDADIVAAFEDHKDFQTTDEHGGFQLLELEDGGWVVGVRDGTVVEGFENFSQQVLADKRTVVEAIVDAKRGEGDRYGDASEPFSRLVDRLGTGAVVSGTTAQAAMESTEEDPEGTVASGWRHRIDGATVRSRFVLLFESESAADPDAVDLSQDRFEDLQGAEVSADGAAVFVEGTTAGARVV